MIADIITIAIIFLSIFLGYQKGLIGVAVKIIGLFAALIVALILYTPVSNYIINNTNAVNSLQTIIEDKMYGNEEEQEESEEITTIEQYIESYTEELKENSTKYISKTIAISIIKVRNMDRTIYNNQNNNDIHKNVCKHNWKNTNNKTI